MRRRAGAGRDRRVEPVDIDGHVIARAFRDAVQHRIHPHLAELAHRDDVGAHRARILVAVAGGG